MHRLVLLLALGACGFRITGAVPGEDAPIDVPSDAPGPWSAPVSIGFIGADDPTLTADLLELYINLASDIYVATRATTSDPWSAPALVTQLSTISGETTPEVVADGLTFGLASDRAGTMGGTDLWIATRPNRGAVWGPLTAVTELNSATGEAGPVITPDLRAIVFTSQRVNGSPDIFVSERASPATTWDPPTEITSLNTTGHEGSAMMTADRLTICFDTDRAGSLDLYCASRASTTDPFGTAMPISELNSPTTNEEDPWISPDGRVIVFSSNRGGVLALWQATR